MHYSEKPGDIQHSIWGNLFLITVNYVHATACLLVFGRKTDFSVYFFTGNLQTHDQISRLTM